MSRRITALNNKGVECLHSGRFQEAIHSFRHAICCAEKAVDTATSPCDGMIKDNCIRVMGAQLACLEESTVVAISPHNMFEMYQGAFLLPRFESLDQVASEISIVLFYNLALAHHVVGFSGLEDAKRHITEALRFYKLAFSVLKATPDGRLEGISLVMGLLNNLAHIFSHFWRTQEAKACNSKLETLLSSPFVAGISEYDGDFFFSTLSHGSVHVCNLAPAA